MKDKSHILNDLMASAASLIEAKIEFTKIVRDQFIEKGNTTRTESLTKDIEEMTQAMNTIRKRLGCWA